MDATHWMLVRQGKVQRMMATKGGKPIKVWPIFETQADAMRMTMKMKNIDGGAVRPAMIGSIDGETLDGHIKMAIKEGCAAACCPQSFDDNDDPVWGWIMFD